MQCSLQYLRVLLTLLLLAVSAGGAFADGGFFGKGGMGEAARVSAPAQKAVILRDGDTHEILLLQTTYHGPAQDFAWVIPVPGLPARDDVFPANQALIDGLDTATQPVIRQELHDPLEPRPEYLMAGMDLGGPAPGMMAGGMGPPGPMVVVHGRMDVGDYDATILSATGPGVLTGWLQQHGYAFPEHGAPVIEQYVARRWYFVALRIRPQVQNEGSTLLDVAPIGIRFPARTLTFPLTISRVSAAEVTTILLLVVDQAPVTCKELPVTVIPAGTKGPRRSTYTSLARAQLAEKEGKALLCEARRKVGSGDVYGALVERTYGPGSSRWAIREDDKVGYAGDGQTATRLVAEVPREAMEDLTFRRCEEAPFRLQATYRATVPTPWWAYVVGSRWGRLGWTVVAFGLMLLALWPRRPVSLAEGTSRDLCRVGYWVLGFLGVLIALVVIAPLVDGWSWRYGMQRYYRNHESATREGLLVVQIALSLWLVPGTVLVSRVLRRTPDELGARALPWFVVLVVMLVGAYLSGARMVGSAGRSDSEGALLVTAFLGLLLLCGATALLAATTAQRMSLDGGVVRAVALSLLSLLLLVPLVNQVCSTVLGVRLGKHAVSSVQYQALEATRSRLRQFREATGAYPARLEDLAATQIPRRGSMPAGTRLPSPARRSCRSLMRSRSTR